MESLASNMGHCLWTGIIEEEHAPEVAAALLSPEMFSGFGVRTLASSMGAYNPMSYHNGSVWPHDNAMVAAGLRRYGFVEEAGRSSGASSLPRRRRGTAPRAVLRVRPRAVPGPRALPHRLCSPGVGGRDAAVPPAGAPRAGARRAGRSRGGGPCGPASMLPLEVDQLHLGESTLELLVTAGSWRARGGPPGVRTPAA